MCLWSLVLSRPLVPCPFWGYPMVSGPMSLPWSLIPGPFQGVGSTPVLHWSCLKSCPRSCWGYPSPVTGPTPPGQDRGYFPPLARTGAHPPDRRAECLLRSGRYDILFESENMVHLVNKLPKTNSSSFFNFLLTFRLFPSEPTSHTEKRNWFRSIFAETFSFVN